MMFSDEEIKEIREGSIMRPGDEIISIHEVCLSDRSFDKKDLGFKNESLLHCDRNDLEPPRSLFRDVFPEGVDHQQARFAWTEEDGNIASLVSEPGFGTTGRTTFGKELDSAFSSQMKEADTSSAASLPIATGRNGLTFAWKMNESLVSSTSSNGSASELPLDRNKSNQGACKVDKTDPRSRFHFVKYVKRQGKTVKLWECGICGREFQHQYTLMRHLPTHTDERNFHCSMCGKSFRQLSTLSQHRAIHSAERPYACELCNKTFNRVSTLISHRKTHSDEKPYKCHMCPKGFHQKGNLRNHLFTHTNERPYRCNICMKGFNQQSNLVCHKNKAHSEDGCSNNSRSRSTPHTSLPPSQPQPDSTKPPVDHCEVSSSSIGYHFPSEESSSTSWQPPSAPPSYPEPEDLSTTDNLRHSGVVVDPIKTYHMGVALATKQTPFALLKPDNNSPVLVKVIDTNLPGGKQMLVPATAEDLRVGGKIVVKNDDNPSTSRDSEAGGEAVQIRVPVVAIVVPSIKPGGRLQLVVEEPHHIYHTALSTDLVNLEPCIKCEDKLEPSIASHDPLRTDEPPEDADDPIKLIIPDNTYSSHSDGLSSSFALPPPAPSPPLGLISMDLFEPIECMPMGPQITPVDNIDQSPPSDDSDIFITKFEESIPLSDSD